MVRRRCDSVDIQAASRWSSPINAGHLPSAHFTANVRPGILFAYLNPVERPCPYNSQDCYQSAGPLAATLLRAWPALNSSRTPFRIVIRERTMSNPKHSKCILCCNPQSLHAQVKSGLNISICLKMTRFITSQFITCIQIQNFVTCLFLSRAILLIFTSYIF